MKRILSILLSAAIATVSLTGRASDGQSSQAETSQPVSSATPEFTIDKIGVTYVESPLNVPSIIEKEQGIFTKAFEKYGPLVEYSNLTTSPGQTQVLASDDIQFLYVVSATSVILSASNDADIKVISTYSRSPEAFRMFTGKDSKIQSAADLKGKKIAGLKDAILHEPIIAYLATADLTGRDVEFVSMDIPDAQAVLVGGTIDHVLLAGPAAYNMEKDGYKVVTTGEDPVDATIVVATSQSSYDKNPLFVKRLLKTQGQITPYMKENSEEVLEMTAKGTELSIDAVEEIHPIYDFSTGITDADITPMKKTRQFVKENAMIKGDVDFDQLILKVE